MMSTPRGHMREEKDTFQYIPLGKGLQALLKNKEICNEVSCLLVNSLEMWLVAYHVTYR